MVRCPPAIALPGITVCPCSGTGCVATDTFATVDQSPSRHGFTTVSSVITGRKSTSDVTFWTLVSESCIAESDRSTIVFAERALSIRAATDGWDDTERWPTPLPAEDRVARHSVAYPRVEGGQMSWELAELLGQLRRRAA